MVWQSGNITARNVVCAYVSSDLMGVGAYVQDLIKVHMACLGIYLTLVCCVRYDLHLKGQESLTV